MLRIITLNLNGIRSAYAKGFFARLVRRKADIVCLQEVKAQETDLSSEMTHPKGFHAHCNCAAKKGDSGVALFSSLKPDRVTRGTASKESDQECHPLPTNTRQRDIQADWIGPRSRCRLRSSHQAIAGSIKNPPGATMIRKYGLIFDRRIR